MCLPWTVDVRESWLHLSRVSCGLYGSHRHCFCQLYVFTKENGNIHVKMDILIQQCPGHLSCLDIVHLKLVSLSDSRYEGKMLVWKCFQILIPHGRPLHLINSIRKSLPLLQCLLGFFLLYVVDWKNGNSSLWKNSLH